MITQVEHFRTPARGSVVMKTNVGGMKNAQLQVAIR